MFHSIELIHLITFVKDHLLELTRHGHYNHAAIFGTQAANWLQDLLGTNYVDLERIAKELIINYNKLPFFTDKELWYKKTVDLLRRFGHPFLATALNKRALLLARDRPAEAFTLMLEAMAIEDSILCHLLLTSSENDRLHYLQKSNANLHKLLSLVYGQLSQSPESVTAALDVLLRRKSLSAAALSVQNQAVFSGRYPHLLAQFYQMKSLSEQIVQQAWSIPNPDEETIYKNSLADLEKQYEEIQRQLARQVPEIALKKELAQANCCTVAKELPQDTTLIEFVCFNYFDFKAVQQEKTQWLGSRYLAFILDKEPLQVQMVDLGEAEPIKQAIQVFADSILNKKLAFTTLEMADSSAPPEIINYNPEAAFKLYKAVLTPICAKLRNSKHLLLAPDSDLNLVPLQVLPVDETGARLLMDEYTTISYISVGRDVLRFKAPASSLCVASAPLLIADPDFDLAAEQTTHPHKQLLPTPDLDLFHSSTLGNTNYFFERAPGTGILGKEVARRLKVKPYLQAKALESLLSTKHCPSLLLIATHGVFFSNSKDMPQIKNPMLRSGLAFAGANTWLKGGCLPPEAKKGFVFAQEVTNLDLWNTSLAVLSACNTGKGEIQAGEGVFGLRRAFAVAGVKTLLMSLWPVKDYVTALLMNRFFENLERGLGRAEALHLAQGYVRTITVVELKQLPLGREVLKELLGVKQLPDSFPYKDKDWRPLSHPYFWGAWILQGKITPWEDVTFARG